MTQAPTQNQAQTQTQTQTENRTQTQPQCTCQSDEVTDPARPGGPPGVIQPGASQPGTIQPGASQPGASQHGVSRRTVLAASAAVVAGLTLAACSSPAETATEATPTPTETPGGGDSAGGGDSTGAGDSTGGGDSAGGDGAGAERLVGTSDLTVGGGTVLMASVGPVVVTHPADGEYKAFKGRCPHAGCPVSSVAGNTITCNCHGSTFDAVTGDRTGGPAPNGLTPLEVTVEGDAVYLT